MSKDSNIGKVKRYSRGIKAGQTEFVSKYVLFRAAYQYFGRLYLDYKDITANLRKEIHLKQIEYDQIKYQMESNEEVIDPQRQILKIVDINLASGT